MTAHRLGCAASAALLAGIVLAPGCRRARTQPRAASPAAWFTDSARATGIVFTHTNGASGRYYYPETNGSGCAWFDANGDGHLDALLVNAAPLPGFQSPGKTTPGLFLNQGDGTFRDATAGSGLDYQAYSTGCAVGDYDNDGRPDLYIAATLGPGRLFHNEGGGKFRDVTSGAIANDGHWGTACAWLDFDRDGLIDLFVGNYLKYRLGSDAPCLYSEGYKSYCGPRWFLPDSPRLFRNMGNGRFRDVSVATGLSKLKQKALGVALLDHNHDGWTDLFVTNDVWENHLIQNESSGRKRRFRDVAVELGAALAETGKTLAGMGVDVADLLGDGRQWVATANFSDEGVAIFRQEDGRFSDASRVLGVTQPSLQHLAFGLSWIDTDNDGVKELLAANGHVHPEIAEHRPHLRYEEPKLLLQWNGQSRFDDVTAQAGPALLQPTVSRGMAVGDYDNDGRIDVLVNNLARPAQLFHNERHAGHWLGLKLVGRTSNRDGFGAAVTVTVGDRKLNDLCRSGGSYCSQSDSRLHFGLGTATLADEIRVAWPSGHKDTIGTVTADQYYELVEGTGAVRALHP